MRLAEKWIDKVYDIKQVSDRIILIKLLVEDAALTVLSVYASQAGLEDSTKDAFMIACKLSSSNYHIKKYLFHVVTGMDTLEKKQLDTKVYMEDIGMVNLMQIEIEYLTLLLQITLSLGILSFTYQSRNAKTQIDFILLRKCNLKMVKNIKVIPSEECVPRNKLFHN